MTEGTPSPTPEEFQEVEIDESQIPHVPPKRSEAHHLLAHLGIKGGAKNLIKESPVKESSDPVSGDLLCQECGGAERIPEENPDAKRIRYVLCRCAVKRRTENMLKTFIENHDLDPGEAAALTFAFYDPDQVEDPNMLIAYLLVRQLAAGTRPLLLPTIPEKPANRNAAHKALSEASRRISELLTEELDRMEYSGAGGEERKAITRILQEEIPSQYLKTNTTGQPKTGVLLVGGTGCGKTHLVTAAAQRAISRGSTVGYTDAYTFDLATTSGRNRYSSPEPGEIISDLLRNTNFLVFDDLGAERDTQDLRWDVLALVEKALRAGIPLALTTNLDIEEIKDRYGGRLTSRLASRCHLIELAEEDHRLLGERELHAIKENPEDKPQNTLL